jgi:hypothetical protein
MDSLERRLFVGRRDRRRRGGSPREIAGENETEQSQENENSGDPEEPAVVQGLLGGAAAVVTFVGMMMVFAHGGAATYHEDRAKETVAGNDCE